MRSVVIVQARMTSTRLPGKVLLPLAGQPMVQRMFERLQRIAGICGVCLAIPDGEEHRPLAELADRLGWILAVGPEDDVLSRYAIAADQTSADYIVRVTSDCPLIDPGVCGTVIALVQTAGAAYGRTAIHTGFPLGLDVEVVRADALRSAVLESTDPFEREHVTPFIWRRPETFGCLMLDRLPDRRSWRLTVDQAEDYDLVRRIFEAGLEASPDFGFDWVEQFLLQHPELLAINQHIAKPVHVGWPKQ